MPNRTVAAMCVVVASLVLAGCGGNDKEDSPVASSTREAGTAAPTKSGTGNSLHSPEWQQHLDEIAMAFGIDNPPEIAPIRLVGEDYVETNNACMSDAGFPVDKTGSFDFPDDQLEAYHLAVYTCEAQYPVDPKYLEPLTDDQYRIVHAYLRDEAVPCLADLGYSIEGPPSEETYAATAEGPEVYTTSGELYKIGLDTVEVESAIARCPEVPSVETLYGGK